MHVRSLSDLLDREIRHLHCLETRIFESLPELAVSSTDERLTTSLERARAITVWQRERLRMIPRTLGMGLSGDPCPDVMGMMEQAKQLVHYASEPEVRDAALISTFRRIVAFSAACYVSARDHARILGETQAVELLQRSLDEEEDALRDLDQLLNSGAHKELLRTA